METLSTKFCDICREKGLQSKVRTICKECREFYCQNCSDTHSIQKISKHHSMVDLSTTHCDICFGKGKQSTICTICQECRELYCDDCSKSHSLQKISKSHMLIYLDPPQEKMNTTYLSDTLLSSDFLQTLTLRKNTISYLSKANVHGGACPQESDNNTPASEENTTDVTALKAGKEDNATDLIGMKARKSGQLGQKVPDENVSNLIAMKADKSREELGQNMQEDKGTDLTALKAHKSGGLDQKTLQDTSTDLSELNVDKRGGISKNIPEDKTTDLTKPKAGKVGEFSVKIPEDTQDVRVTGILTLAGKVIVSDLENKKLKLFGQNLRFLSSVHTRIKHKHFVIGLTRIDSNKFATCDPSDNRIVCIWALCGDTVECEDTVYNVEHKSHGIHFDGLYYSVLHGQDNAITVLDTQGRQVRKIVLKEVFGERIRFSYGITMDSVSHNIYVSCRPEKSGVLCVSIEGDLLWFTPLSGNLCGLTAINDILGVADLDRNVHLMTKRGEYKGMLLDKESLAGPPYFIYYDTSDEKLYIAFHDDVIHVFQIK